MAAVIKEREKEERREVVEILKKQINIEGELITQYKDQGKTGEYSRKANTANDYV